MRDYHKCRATRTRRGAHQDSRATWTLNLCRNQNRFPSTGGPLLGAPLCSQKPRTETTGRLGALGGNDCEGLVTDETTTMGGTTGTIHSYLDLQNIDNKEDRVTVINNKEDRVTGVVDGYRNKRCNHMNTDMEQRKNKPESSFDLDLYNPESDVELKKKKGMTHPYPNKKPPRMGGPPREEALSTETHPDGGTTHGRPEIGGQPDGGGGTTHETDLKPPGLKCNFKTGGPLGKNELRSSKGGGPKMGGMDQTTTPTSPTTRHSMPGTPETAHRTPTWKSRPRPKAMMRQPMHGTRGPHRAC